MSSVLKSTRIICGERRKDDKQVFTPVTIDRAGIQPWETHPCSAITPKVGLALAFSSGKLAIAAGTTKPEFICMENRDSAVTAGTMIHVMPVNEHIVFETKASAALTSVTVGSKVTLTTDGLKVTATTTGGVAEILEMDGTAAGSKVRVRFPELQAAAANS